MANYKVISSDSHVTETQSFYQQRVPVGFRHRTPRIEVRNGATYRIVEGRRPRRLDLAESRLTEDDKEREFRKDPSGGTDIPLRISDQRKDGVNAEVVYPDYTLWLFSSPDPVYQMAVARAYNDWAMELFGPHPDRFAHAAVVPVADISQAVAEVERAGRLGYRVVMIPALMSKRPYNRPEYDPFPEGIGEEEMGGFLKWIVCGMSQVQEPITDFIASGVLQRHPGIQFALVECGAGWLAWLLYALDEHVEKKHMWVRPRLDLLPSQYFQRQGHVTFGDDPVALRTLDFIGSQCLLWGSDYPHDEGTFPHSREVIDRTFVGILEEDKRKIIGENAVKLYGFSVRSE